ncbi:MAG TPA: glycosyltransferase domain-containing protein [Pyrinomonadaceae bacterium]|nr:glycosyltransferase domain-containing protein [Pyrinomonadaceae bacterium]
MRVAIYTAIYGGYDNLKAQPAQTLDCDFICFTDDAQLTPVSPWRVVHSCPEETADLHPRLQSRYPKQMAHRFFRGRSRRKDGRLFEDLRRSPTYDYCIWIDASAQILKNDFAEFLISHVGQFGIAMLRHPDRDCIFDEVLACINLRNLKGLPLSEQVEHYRRQGYPEHNGLFAGGLIVRDLQAGRLKSINSQWWKENLRWSSRDQLSLPYLLWKNGYGIDEIPLNLWKNDYFVITDHLKRTA